MPALRMGSVTRYARKGTASWIGYEVHLTETCDGRRLMTLRAQDEHQALAGARRRRRISDFAALYAWRAGVEATMSWAVRGFGPRRARYVGLAKVRLRHTATAAALNLIRLTRWIMGAPIPSTRAGPFTRLFRLPV